MIRSRSRRKRFELTARASQTVKLFEAGIKPAVLLFTKENAAGEATEARRLARAGYPSCEWRESTSRVFFQTEEDRRAFEQKEKTFSGLGIALGFPPSAAEVFECGMPDEERFFINYHGIQFATRADLVGENLAWMSKKFAIPPEMRTRIEIRRLDETGKKSRRVCLIESAEDFDPSVLENRRAPGLTG